MSVNRSRRGKLRLTRGDVRHLWVAGIIALLVVVTAFYLALRLPS